MFFEMGGEWLCKGLLKNSLSIRPYRLLFPTGLLDYILCPHMADVDKFFQIGQHWHVHE